MDDYLVYHVDERVPWIHNREVVKRDVLCPCLRLWYCPYGSLVEWFPLRDEGEQNELCCPVYGHDCPVFYQYEDVSDGMGLRQVEQPDHGWRISEVVNNG